MPGRITIRRLQSLRSGQKNGAPRARRSIAAPPGQPRSPQEIQSVETIDPAVALPSRPRPPQLKQNSPECSPDPTLDYPALTRTAPEKINPPERDPVARTESRTDGHHALRHAEQPDQARRQSDWPASGRTWRARVSARSGLRRIHRTCQASMTIAMSSVRPMAGRSQSAAKIRLLVKAARPRATATRQ